MNELFPPKYISAKTPEKLRQLMIQLNIMYGRNFRYFDFSHVKGKWGCWFQLSMEDEMQIINKKKANNE